MSVHAQKIKLIILFMVSTLLFFSLALACLPVSYHIWTTNETVDWKMLLHIPQLVDFGVIGLLIGLFFSIFGTLRFSPSTIVGLIRFFIITFILLSIIIYISLKAM